MISFLDFLRDSFKCLVMNKKYIFFKTSTQIQKSVYVPVHTI